MNRSLCGASSRLTGGLSGPTDADLCDRQRPPERHDPARVTHDAFEQLAFSAKIGRRQSEEPDVDDQETVVRLWFGDRSRLQRTVCSAELSPILGALTRRYDAGLHSTRRGDFRVIYRINEADRRIDVVAIEHRSDVYRSR